MNYFKFNECITKTCLQVIIVTGAVQKLIHESLLYLTQHLVLLSKVLVIVQIKTGNYTPLLLFAF